MKSQSQNSDLVVEKNENAERRQTSGCQRMKCLEKQNELEISRNLLELRSQRRNSDELCDVEEKGNDNHGDDMPTHGLVGVRVPLLKSFKLYKFEQ